MRALQVVSLVVAAFSAGCTERPLLDTAHPAITGKIAAVSHRDVERALTSARQHLVQTGRTSHIIYGAEIWEPDMIGIAHAEPPRRKGDCLESFVLKRIHGHWQLWGRELVCGENIPTG